MVGGDATPRATTIALKSRQCVAPSGVVVGHGGACYVVPNATAEARGVVGTYKYIFEKNKVTHKVKKYCNGSALYIGQQY